jgi:hypothetical protein
MISVFNVALVWSGASMLGGLSAGQIDDYLLLFEGVCVRNMHDVSIVEKMAKTAQWNEIPEEMAAGLAPIEGELLGSWFVMLNDVAAVAAVSEGSLGERRISSCAIATKVEDPDDVVYRMQELFRAKQISDETEGFQRLRAFTATISGLEILMTALTATHPAAMKTVNLVAQFPIR